MATTALVGNVGALPAQAGNYTVTSNADDGSVGTLRYAINQANAAGGNNTITFANPLTITLQSNLPLVANSVTINAAGSTLDGQGQYRGLLITGVATTSDGTPPAITVGVTGLNIQNVKAQGGNGADSGGGGIGAGGAVFVGENANVTLTNVNVSHADAQGGAGAARGGATPGAEGNSSGGGGGLAGAGGAANSRYDGAGGGGGGLLFPGGGASGGNQHVGGGGGGGGITGAGGNGTQEANQNGDGGNGGAGLAGTGGGGGGGSFDGTPGTRGGTGAAAGANLNGGNGGFGGGGGGGTVHSGNGGFGGGGGGNNGNVGGTGGFGGGGGGGNGGGDGGFGGGGGGAFQADTSGGAGGIGAGAGIGGGPNGLNGVGGGGLSAGGAIFVVGSRGGNLGGTLTVVGGSLANDTVTASTGANAGATVGQDIFTMTGATTVLAPNGGTLTINGTVADDSAASLPAGGSYTPGTANTAGGGLTIGQTGGTGTVALNAANTYAGGTTLTSGALAVTNSTIANGTIKFSSIGTGALTFNGGTLQAAANNLSFANAAKINTIGGTIDTNGNTLTWSGVIADGNGVGGLTKIGAGTLALTAANTYTGGTAIAGGTLSVANDGNLGAASGGLTFSGGTLEVRPANGFTSARAVTLTAAGTVQVDTAENTATLSGVIGGPGSLTKTGSGVLFLAGTNSYAGGTTISAGALQLGNGGNTGSITGAVTNNANLLFNRSNTYQFDGVISGTGAVRQIGTGTTILTAANTYSGGTTISAGTLQLGNGGTTGSITGNVTDNGTLAVNRANATTIAGVISGTGALQQIGTGTTTLTAANTYTGPTNITAGTLAGGAANTFSAASATTIATGGTLDLGGFAQTINAVALNGGILRNGALTGAVTSTGGTLDTLGGPASVTTKAGTTMAIGTNTYTGGTTISGGTLQLGNGGTTGSIVGNVIDNATLAFNRSDVSTFGGVISGTGAVQQNGTGTTILTAANSYTGGTTILAGTLQLGNGGTTGSIVGNVTDNFNLAFNRSDAITFGGIISGTGNVQQIGIGTTILTAANTYTSGTTISGGTLQLGNGGTTGSIVGNVTDNGNLAFNRSDVVTFSGIISGTGNVQQIGTGTTILTAANTYTGATTINVGTLQVDGSIASPNVVVNNGGTLSGIGKIGDPQINAGGTLAPGNAANPTGTLTIVGPLGFAAGSFYNVAITPSANSRTNVTGVTTIAGGTVQVMAGSGTYATNQRYTILTSTGGVAGTFTRATANTNFAFLTPTLSYDANDVYVTVLPMAPIVTTNPMTGAPTTVPNYRTAAGTQNQLAVASGLTRAGIQNGGTGRVLTALNQLTTQQARAAFDSLSGEGLTATQNIANRSAELFTSSIFDQTTFYGSGNAANSITLTEPIRELADLPSRAATPVFVQPNRTWRAWATGFGGVDDIHGNSQIGSSYQQNTIYGGTLGVDYQLTPNYLIGVAIGGTNGDFLVPGRATSGSTTGGHVAFYDLATFGSFYGASSTSFSYFGNRATRTVSGFGGLGTETERANFNSDEFRSRLEFGRHLAGYGGVLTPFVALELAELRSNGFTESAVQGAGLFRLNVSGQSQASAPAFVGLRLQRATSIGNGITLSPTLQVAYVHEFAPYRSQIGTLADLPGSTFLVDGARPGRNAAQVKAGAEMAIGANSVIFANFDGEFSGVNQLYAGKGGFRYAW